jgi:hypothetical protein
MIAVLERDKEKMPISIIDFHEKILSETVLQFSSKVNYQQYLSKYLSWIGCYLLFFLSVLSIIIIFMVRQSEFFSLLSLTLLSSTLKLRSLWFGLTLFILYCVLVSILFFNIIIEGISFV